MVSGNYYAGKLNAYKLMQCYEIAPARVRQFLEAEIAFILGCVAPGDQVLDLGCGYGRISRPLSVKAGMLTGIDISEDSIELAREYTRDHENCVFFVMDAAKTDFPDGCFDLTLCAQNGISAFKSDPAVLLRESVRVTKEGGTVLYSSYSEKFWEHRLEWFRLQSEHGLIGEIDEELTKNGVIACRDGFRATTCTGRDFLELAAGCGVAAEIIEVDESVLFCRMKKGETGP